MTKRPENDVTRRAVDQAALLVNNARRAHDMSVQGVIEALLAGASLRQVAEACGLAVNTVIRYRDEAGLVPYSGHIYGNVHRSALAGEEIGNE